MARRLRLEYPGAIYHVTVRMLGDGRLEESRLFRDDQDRQRLLDRLEEAVEEFGVRLYQYCLMENHFHLVLETPEANLSRFMHSVSTGYTIYYNLRHRRHGHLVDGRFKDKVVEGDPASPRLCGASDYLLALSRYVHLNPVHIAGWDKKPVAERARRLRAYRWSTYQGYVGMAPRQAFVSYEPVLALVGGRKRSRERLYREFVETGLAESDEEFAALKNGAGLSIGGEAFAGWVQELYQKTVEGHGRAEDAVFRKVSRPLEAKVVLGAVQTVLKVEANDLRRKSRDSTARAVAARFLTRMAGLTQREAARELGIGSGSAVSQLLIGLTERLDRDSGLRKQVDAIAVRLKSAKPHRDNLHLQG